MHPQLVESSRLRYRALQAPSIGLFSPFRAEGVSTGNALLRAKKLPKKLPTIERALYKAGGNPTGPFGRS